MNIGCCTGRHNRAMARRAVGSNQYKTRVGSPDVQTPDVDLMAQVGSRLAEFPQGKRMKLAENPLTPPEVLAHLAHDTDWGVRGLVAEHSNTPPEVLARLAGDKNADVRNVVAENPSTPPDILTQLAGDRLDWVRNSVAENRNTPPEVLVLLAGDVDADVRQAAEANPSFSEEYRALRRVAQ